MATQRNRADSKGGKKWMKRDAQQGWIFGWVWCWINKSQSGLSTIFQK
jgi:hypothetical protein